MKEEAVAGRERCSYGKRGLWVLALLASSLVATSTTAQEVGHGPLGAGVPVRGWTILSSSEPDDMATIAAAPAYRINHIELSHQIVGELRELKDPPRSALVNRLIDAAHKAGVSEVVLWDHSLYDLAYYPAQFRTGPGGTLDFDNAAFWEWFKADYRSMLDRAPHADGVVLTFIETGAHAERQQSEKMKSAAEKLAAVVNAVGDVVIGERHLNLYVRVLADTHAEFGTTLDAVNRIAHPEVRLILKNSTHEFYLNRPNDRYAGTIARPTVMEYDCAGEFHGQGIVANTWPEEELDRWRDLSQRPHVSGYVARTDRFGASRQVGKPGEINLYALKRAAEDRNVLAEDIYDEFITARYGARALPEVKAAFKESFDIATSSFYTLGIDTAFHSALSFEPSEAILEYSDTWFEPSIEQIGHGVGREFHLVRDVIDHIAEPKAKPPATTPWKSVPWVIERGWIHPGEGMDEPTLRYLVAEKNFGVATAQDALRHIENARAQLSPQAYDELHGYFERTLLTARIWRATSSAYLGFRAWSRGPAYRTPYVEATIRNGMAEIREVAPLIRNYPGAVPTSQWEWRKDADAAEKYAQAVTAGGWTETGTKR
jgi:hypothetical protein